MSQSFRTLKCAPWNSVSPISKLCTYFYACRLRTHEGRNQSQWVARLPFSPVGCLVEKPCPKEYSWRTKGAYAFRT